MDRLWEFAASQGGFNFIIGVIAAVFAWLKAREASKKWGLETCLQFLETGVRTVYEGYIRSRKAANADGKLTDAERREAVDRAIAEAKDLARTQGVDILKVYGAAYLPVLIDSIIRRWKGEAAAGAPVVIPGVYSDLDGPEIEPTQDEVVGRYTPPGGK